jgi:[acyl-carrier-protein] S-malonyltransferase
MKTAFLYAGQGAQQAGMGQDLYEKYPVFKAVYDMADTIRPGLKNIIFENKDNALLDTENTQPALAAFAVGVTKILEEKNIFPEAVLGLSLGEYSALAGAGVFSPENVLKAVTFRGKKMKEAGAGGDWGMSAVLGMSEDDIRKACQEAGCYPTNFNCPGQIVISGEKESVDKAGELLKEAGAKRVIPLAVSGPFHTPYMKSAGDALAEFLPTVGMSPAKCQIIFNATGDDGDVKPFENEKEKIVDLLVRQVQNPVLMEKSLDLLLDEGFDDFIEIGPGKTLSGFVKKCAKAKGIKCIGVRTLNTVEDIESL